MREAEPGARRRVSDLALEDVGELPGLLVDATASSGLAHPGGYTVALASPDGEAPDGAEQ